METSIVRAFIASLGLDPRPFILGGAARSRSFRTMWFGQAASQLGSSISLTALPLIAALVLHATPAQMGLLIMLENVPAMFLTVPSAILGSHISRRTVLISADLLRSVVVFLVPFTYILGMLSFQVMAFVALGMGALTVVFNANYESFVTELIDEPDYLGGYRRLRSTEDGASVIGPSVGGVLLSAFGAAFAVSCDAVSYLVSACSLWFTRRRPNYEPRPIERTTWRGEFLRGFSVIFSDRPLRDLAVAMSLQSLGVGVFLSLVVLFATRNLGLSAAAYGVIYSISGTGFLLGTKYVESLQNRFGAGRMLVASAWTFVLAMAMVPLAGPGIGLVLFVVGRFVNSVANATFNLLMSTQRQLRTNDQTRNYVVGSFNMASVGAIPIGSLLAIVLGSYLGVRDALLVAVILPALGALLLQVGPVRTLRTTFVSE